MRGRIGRREGMEESKWGKTKRGARWKTHKRERQIWRKGKRKSSM